MRIRWLVGASAAALAAAAAWLVLARGGPSEGTTPSPAPADWLWSVTVDSGGGHVGPWRMNDSDWRYVDDPAVALGPEGGAVVAWVDQGRKDVLLQRWGPGGEALLEAPVDVSRSPDVFSWLPRVAVSPDDPDRVYVLWQEIVFSGGTHGGEAFFARSTDGGRSFGEPINLSETPAGAGKGRLSARRWHNGSLDLELGPDGTVHAAWTVYEGGLFTARSEDGGRSFSGPLRVTGPGGAEPARAPSLAAGPGDTLRLAWAVGEDPGGDLRLAASDDGGRSFGEARVLFVGDARADAPALAVADDGTLHLAWDESPAGREGGHRVRHARSPAGADGFAEPVTAAGPGTGPGGSAPEGARFPSLALDGAGDPWLVWEAYPDGGGRSPALGLARWEGGGSGFGEPAAVPGTADPEFGLGGSLQGPLMQKLDVSADGGVAVVNSAFEPGEASRVRLVRGRAGSRSRGARPPRPGRGPSPEWERTSRPGRRSGPTAGSAATASARRRIHGSRRSGGASGA
jgi:hypothetical protein